MSRWLVLGLCGLLLTGCATRDVAFRPQAQANRPQDTPFSISGRLSVKADGKGQVANFDWNHDAGRDQLSINSPIGSTVARVERDGNGVTLQADGKTYQAADVESLTEQTLGWPLPLSNLAWWIRGLAAPDWPQSVSADGVLHQQGWAIRFISDAGQPGPFPKRVEMERDQLSIRLVVHAWR
ncbi:MAG: outer membrane lipoprotein LolB [Pseudogulbenkiania sp.]|nr:outer membrane lipoprotein LolB [Pseudogulbenkiania sp.]